MSDYFEQNTLCWCCNFGVGKSLEISVSKNKSVIPKANRNIWTHCRKSIVCFQLTRFSEQLLEKCVYSIVLWSLKDKASRIERIVGEHRLFSQGLKELQDWVCEAQRVLHTCNTTTTDKSVLEDRMLQLEVRRDKKGGGI